MSGEATRSAERVALSVVIPTTQGWPAVALPLDSLMAEARAQAVEVIVADGSGGAPQNCAGVRWLSRPGATVFELRAAAIEAATGEIVAVTEDHVQVEDGYCREVLAAHAASPAWMIGGVVKNGSRDPVGWASYFMSNVAALPPERGPWRAPLTGQANISYKRELLRRWPAERLQDASLRADLEARGLAHNDARFAVLHIQSLGVLGSARHHFHDGRSVAARRRAAYGGPRWALELAKDLALPWRIPVAAGRVVGRVAQQYPSLRPELAAASPLIAMLMIAHCAGELAGFIGGVGDADTHIP